MRYAVRFASIALIAAASAVHAYGQDAPPVTIDLFDPAAAPSVDPIAETTLGMRVELKEFMIPGSDLVPVPVEDPGRADIIIDVKHTYPHGENRRYDLSLTPFVAGDIDLRDHLVRADGSSLDDVPPLVLRVDTVLPDTGEIVEPLSPEVRQPSRVGGYRILAVLVGSVWVVGLLLLLFAGRKRTRSEDSGALAPPPTLADRLRPLVEGASAGTLAPEQRAELERLVLAHWRRQRGLENATAADAITALRRDAEAGPLLHRLEEWLHRPGATAASDAEVNALLEPFRSAPAAQHGGART